MARTSLRTALKRIGMPNPCVVERDALAISQDNLAHPTLPDESPLDPGAIAASILALEAGVVAAQSQLDACLEAIPVAHTIHVPGDFKGPHPSSVRELLRACLPPRMGEWTNPERSYAENQDWTEELNGLVTDGHSWYASCNADDDREGLYKLSMSFEVERKIEHPFNPDEVHIGALAVREGHVFVPMQQGIWGIWVVDQDLNEPEIFTADDVDRPEVDLFAWCDVNPHNGLLYTCNFSQPQWLYAYERREGHLKRAKASDIPLHQPGDGKLTTSVQSGCFTPNYKWLAVCDVDQDERIHCHSTLSGAFLERRPLLADTDEGPWVRNELEGIWYATIHTARGNHVQVHVLELNNEVGSADDMYLWHFSLPALHDL